MKLDSFNFLTNIKNLVTGGGRTASGLVKQDCGFAKDMNFSLNDMIPSLVDNTTGTVGSTIAAGVGQFTLTIPATIQTGTGAGDAITNYTPGYNFKILSWSFTDDVVGVGSGASRVYNMEIDAVDVGTVPSTITLTEAGTNTKGKQTAGTGVTGANTGSAVQTFSIEVASGGTAFTAGSGTFTVQIQNMDTANAIASLAAQNLISVGNLRLLSVPAGITTVGALTLVIPRDYDENTDTFALKISAAMVGATDTPTLAASAYRKRPGASVATVAAAVPGKNVGQTATISLSTASQVVEFNFSQGGVKRDDAITILITSDAHTTDAIIVYSVEPVYRSTLVSYFETDGANAQTGNPLR